MKCKFKLCFSLLVLLSLLLIPIIGDEESDYEKKIAGSGRDPYTEKKEGLSKKTGDVKHIATLVATLGSRTSSSRVATLTQQSQQPQQPQQQIARTTPPISAKLVFRTKTKDGIFSSPAIGPDGTIYFGSSDGHLYALTPDGTEKWEFYTGGSEFVFVSPTIGPDNVIYIGSMIGYWTDTEGDDGGYLYAITPDGKEKWKVNLKNWVWSTPAIGSDGRTIYVGSYDGNLYAIKLDGSIKWKFDTRNWIASSPTIGPDGTIYFGNYGKFYAIMDSNTKATMKWSIALENPEDWVSSSAAISSDGTIYVGSYNGDKNGNLHAITPDGRKKWKFAARARIYSSPAIGPDGTIYVGTRGDNGKLYAVKPDGTKKWEFPIQDVSSSPAVGVDGTIYVGSRDGNLYAINPDGTEKWRFTTGGWVYTSPVIAPDGTIYFGSDDGNLYAIANEIGVCGSLAPTPSPMFHHDPRHTGNYSTIIPTLAHIVGPSTPIQQVIDKAAAGSAICLLKGEWQNQNLNITKPITLWGIGKEGKSKLTNSKISVNISSPTEKVYIKNIELSNADTVIAINAGEGAVEVSNSKIVGGTSTIGISIATNKTSLVVEDSEISGALYGIQANSFKSILVKNSKVMNNTLHAIFAKDGENVEVRNSQILGNGSSGITLVDGVEKSRIDNTTINENGGSNVCNLESHAVCAGIVVGGKTEITLKDVTITDNKHWGIACTLKKCGFSTDSFEGKVIKEGGNTIANECLKD